jgi:hypothetical protein
MEPLVSSCVCCKVPSGLTLIRPLTSRHHSASFISVVRFIWLVKTQSVIDVPFEYVPIATWTSIETNTAVAIACLMTFKPLLTKFFPNMMGSSHRAGSDGQEAEGGRVLTIGSKPVRPAWNVFHSRHGGGDEIKDLEAHAQAQEPLPNRQPLESGTTLETDAETEAKVDLRSKSSGDTIVVQKD